MSSCLSDEQLRQLLDEKLGQADEAWMVIHVETCERCQERLDDVIRGRAANLPWLPVPSAQAAVEMDSAPIANGQADSSGAAGVSSGAPTAIGDVTVDFDQSFEPTSAGDAMSSGIEARGAAVPTEVDPRDPQDSPASTDIQTPSNPDSRGHRGTSLPIMGPQPTSYGPSESVETPLDVDTAQMTADGTSNRRRPRRVSRSGHRAPHHSRAGRGLWLAVPRFPATRSWGSSAREGWVSFTRPVSRA